MTRFIPDIPVLAVPFILEYSGPEYLPVGHILCLCAAPWDQRGGWHSRVRGQPVPTGAAPSGALARLEEGRHLWGGRMGRPAGRQGTLFLPARFSMKGSEGTLLPPIPKSLRNGHRCPVIWEGYALPSWLPNLTIDHARSEIEINQPFVPAL